ncbi:hypothetical protein D3C75_493760 [compost metagenome]
MGILDCLSGEIEGKVSAPDGLPLRKVLSDQLLSKGFQGRLVEHLVGKLRAALTLVFCVVLRVADGNTSRQTVVPHHAQGQ